MQRGMPQAPPDTYLQTTGQKATTRCPVVFFDITIGDEPAGRIEMLLRKDVVPITTENFRALCTGEKNDGLTYKGCPFHRIVPGQVVHGGDITRGDGTGGRSIYDSDEYAGSAARSPTFKDENFKLSHSEPGVLSMANSGRNKNSSQFFICLDELSDEFDCRHVVFGNVTSGMEVARAIEAVGTPSGKPLQPVVIADCGQLGWRAPPPRHVPPAATPQTVVTQQMPRPKSKVGKAARKAARLEEQAKREAELELKGALVGALGGQLPDPKHQRVVPVPPKTARTDEGGCCAIS